MRFPSSEFVRRALSGHAAIGLIAGAFLYLLCLSGTLIVMHEELQRWEEPGVAEMAAIAPQSVQRAIDNVLASEGDKAPTTHLYVHMPNDALPRTVVTTDSQAVYVDAAGNVVAPEAHAWTEFLVALHYYLHLPRSFGMMIVGVFGVMMAALIVGGVLAHPRIFRDAFRLRARGGKQLAQADWHNRLGVWTLPFGLVIAITGAWIGLATIMAYAMAGNWYGGDTTRVFEQVFGAEPAASGPPVARPRVDLALADMARRHPDVPVSYVVLHDPAQPEQHIQLIGQHSRRLIFGEYYHYDAQGRYHGTAHLSDGTIGQQLAASTYKLHFGTFGGLPVRLAYVLMGLAVTVVSATGTSIWLIKRRQRGRPGPRLEAAWSALLWGSPAAILLCVLLRWAAGTQAPLTPAFWAGLVLWVAAAVRFADPLRTALWSRTALGGLLALTGIGHAAIAGPLSPATLPIDIAMVLAALAVLPWSALPDRRAALAKAAAQPAE
ncbi:PepSY-associated TM helix domain-containing protein [Sphingomonas sp.]